MSTRPAVGSTMRNRVLMRVDLPQPVRPTMPIFSLGLMLRVRPFRTRSKSSLYLTYIHRCSVHQCMSTGTGRQSLSCEMCHDGTCRMSCVATRMRQLLRAMRKPLLPTASDPPPPPSSGVNLLLQATLERQYLPCIYLAHHQLETIKTVTNTLVIVDLYVTAGRSPFVVMSCFKGNVQGKSKGRSR